MLYLQWKGKYKSTVVAVVNTAAAVLLAVAGQHECFPQAGHRKAIYFDSAARSRHRFSLISGRRAPNRFSFGLSLIETCKAKYPSLDTTTTTTLCHVKEKKRREGKDSHDRQLHLPAQLPMFSSPIKTWIFFCLCTNAKNKPN
jgi:hypothetical protein